MDHRNSIWIAVIDGREGRLLRGRPTTTRPAKGPKSRARAGRDVDEGALRLDVVESIENPLEELHEDGPQGTPGEIDPRRVRGRRSELLARYAVDVVKWLDVHAKKREIDDLVVFAPQRLRSLLQAMYPQSLTGRVRGHGGDLGTLNPLELERHPDVVRLLDEDGDETSSRRAS